ncbi:carboxypeptidase-like regulatory domain-containing protein [Flavobacterium humi]|uniref:Carboxypeptidase-like regulatory domain-containing protein n=1 Tax=Flavobacterium humi TaxID=2562683 RepID=A0A4Z0L8Z5_9FLAO|nr:carboxypeptidase-like regulatory domain-containing protein [Flavobacterium humi]TGD58738.1 carboxypeptidase-like regulatory domain-containing protein [Flavobacterium humi]
MNRFNFLLFLIIGCGLSLHAQSIISGQILDSAKNPIPFANVSIKVQNGLTIIAFTTTDNNGNYNLKTNKTGDYNLCFSALSFKAATFPVALEGNKNYIQNASLADEIVALNEVIVQNERAITIKQDTIIMNANAFSKGNETVVEDLLKNLPGINVSEDGTIRVGNQEIEKVMVEGDDFFERGYKLLTKNMNANTIDKIEIYKKYSSNRLLKGIENSNKVALNLKLKKGLKMQWFGNIDAGYGLISENRYETRTNLMSFDIKAKYYLLGNLNNTGVDATGDINHLIRPFRLDDIETLGDDQQANSLLNLNIMTPSLKEERTKFNNAEMISLNAIHTLSPKVKMKTLGFFNWDENDSFLNEYQFYQINGTSFTNTNNLTLTKKKIVGFGKIDLNYDLSNNKMLEFTSKYNNEHENGTSQLIFNETPTNEKLKGNNQLIDEKIVFTNKINDNKVLVLVGRCISEKTPQTYNINALLFPDLFSGQNVDKVIQQSENKMQFSAIDGNLLDRKRNGSLLEVKTGLKHRQDILNTRLMFQENNTIATVPEEYQNSGKYASMDAYLNAKYSYKKGRYTLTGEMEAHQLFNKYTDVGRNEKQAPFFVNPKIGFNIEINKSNRFFSVYSYNKTNAGILDVYSNYVLTGYRNFDKGTSNINQLQASSILLNYGLGNWGAKFFANASFIYTKNHDFYSTNSTIIPNYSQVEKIIIKNQDLLSVSLDGNYFIKAITSNFKLNFVYSNSNFKNVVNNKEREIKTNNFNYAFELRSAFRGMFNYHVGSKWKTSETKTNMINKNTINISFLDLIFDFNKKFNISLESERYFFGNLDKNNKYYFLDFESKYTVQDNKLSFTLSGKNLFGTKTFREYHVNDISVYGTEYRLLPRYVLLRIDYRF